MKKLSIYLCSILLCILLSVYIGSELVTQYEMFATGQTRHELGGDLGFGILLFIWLVPEVVIGILLGSHIGKRINSKISIRTTE